MRILLITQSYMPVLGGLQKAVHQLALKLLAQKHIVAVVTNRYPRSLSENEQHDQIPVERLSLVRPDLEYLLKGRPDLWIYGVWNTQNYRSNINSIPRRFMPDLIHYHYPMSMTGFVLQMLDSYKPNLPLVVTFHGTEVLETSLATYKQQEHLRSLLFRANAVTAVSQNIANAVEAYVPSLENNVKVIYNGIEIRKEQASSIRDDSFIIAVGRLHELKGFHILIEAFSLVIMKQSDTDVSLIVVGDGPQEQQLKDLAHRLNIGSRVKFVGRLDSSELATLYSHALFVVIPSLFEAFGLVALEAMQYGRRIIASEVGGLVEIVPSGDNQLVPTASTIHLANAINCWLSQKDFNPHSESNVSHVRKFSLNRMVRAYLTLYKRILNE